MSQIFVGKKGKYQTIEEIGSGGFATVYKALGIDWTKTYTGLDGRPLYIANSIGDKQGHPVHELI